MKLYKIIGVLGLLFVVLVGLASAQNDRDGDGLPDTRDQCPDAAGALANNGCPPSDFAPNPQTDSDRDGIPDSSDACPQQAGLAEWGGCPDTDSDRIPDIRDNCPTVAGVVENNGCPAAPPPNNPVPSADTDNDGIPDTEDVCPAEAGYREWNGCADVDGDGLTTQYDACPTVAGPRENGGCPSAGANPTPSLTPTSIVGPRTEAQPVASTATRTPRPTLPESGCYVMTQAEIGVNVRPSRSTDGTPVGSLSPYEVYAAEGVVDGWVFFGEGRWGAAEVLQVSPNCPELNPTEVDQLTDASAQGNNLVCGHFYAQFQNISGEDHQALLVKFPDAALGPAENGTWNHWGPMPISTGETVIVEKTLYLQPDTDFDYLLAGPYGTSFAVIGTVSFLPVQPYNCQPPDTSACYFAVLSIDNSTPYYVPIEFVIQPYLFPYPAEPHVTSAPPAQYSEVVVYQWSTWVYEPDSFVPPMFLTLGYNNLLLDITASEVQLDVNGDLCNNGGVSESEERPDAFVMTPGPSGLEERPTYNPLTDYRAVSQDALDGNLVCGHFQGTYQNNSAEPQVLLMMFPDAFSGLPEHGNWDHWGPSILDPGESITVDKKLFLAPDTDFDIFMRGYQLFTPIGGTTFEEVESNQCQLPMSICYYATLTVENLTDEFLDIRHHIRPQQFPINIDDPWTDGFGNSITVAPPSRTSELTIFQKSYWRYDPYEYQGYMPEAILLYDNALLNVTINEVGILAQATPNLKSVVTQNPQVESNGNCEPPITPVELAGLEVGAPTGLANDPDAYICFYFEQTFWNPTGVTHPTHTYQYILRDEVGIMDSLSEPFSGTVFSGTERFQDLRYVPITGSPQQAAVGTIDLIITAQSPEVVAIGPRYDAILDDSYCDSGVPPFTLNEAYGADVSNCQLLMLASVTYENLTDSHVTVDLYLTDAQIADIGLIGVAITEPSSNTWVPGEVASKTYLFIISPPEDGFPHYHLTPDADIPLSEFSVQLRAGHICGGEM